MSGRRELTVFWQTLLIEHNECFYAVHFDSLVSDFGTDDAPDAATFARTEDTDGQAIKREPLFVEEVLL